MDLAEFLNARLDEDEAKAKAALGDQGRWHWVDPGGKESKIALVAGDWNPERAEAWQRSSAGWNIVVPVHGDRVRTDDADHIARWDPARVLREVEAKRRILARHLELFSERKTHPDDLALAGALLAVLGVVRALAAVYSDHPDYDPAWMCD